MYKCQICGKQTRPHQKINRIVTETRERNYINEFKDKKGNKREKISTGYEIVKELNVCNECFKKEGIKC